MRILSLFSGCGGLDKGFVDAGYEVVWANDFDKYAVQTYQANFGDHIVLGDINKIEITDLPAFDMLIGGFPCQPFSMMGEERGFEDARGTLFFRIAEILKYKIEQNEKPRVVVLENVRSLKTHNKGKTFKTILSILENDLGYKVFYDILNTADYGIPQTRNRTYIVCFANEAADFSFPEKLPLNSTLQDLLETDVDDKYFLSDRILPTILSDGTGGYKAKSEIDLKIARPLCATMAKMHRACQDNYVTQNGRVRRLTPRECARLQGFNDDFVIPVSDSQAYKQFGNAVSLLLPLQTGQIIDIKLGDVRSTQFREIIHNDVKVKLPNNLRKDIINSVNYAEMKYRVKYSTEDKIFEYLYSCENKKGQREGINRTLPRVYEGLGLVEMLEKVSGGKRDKYIYPAGSYKKTAIYNMLNNGANIVYLEKLTGLDTKTLLSDFVFDNLNERDIETNINSSLLQCEYYEYL